MEQMTVKQLVDSIRSADENVRVQACSNADKAGPKALKPLAEAAASSTLAVSVAAKRAMWRIVYAEGAPGAMHRKAAEAALLELLGDGGQPVEIRREVLWMISELCETKRAAAPVGEILDDENLREDARQVLERLPGKEAVAALQAGFVRADEEFKYNLAHSLRNRGVKVAGYPNQKLLPVKARVPG